MKYGYSKNCGEDMHFVWGEGCSSRDGALLHYVLNTKHQSPTTREFAPSLIDELVKRGYDISTFRLTVCKLRAGSANAKER